MPVPAAERLVGRSRAQLDPAAALGVPAHVTILYPFLAPALIDDSVLAELSSMFSGVARFAVSFASLRWFGTDVAWLAPRPDDEFRRLTAVVHDRWPACPPYGGTYGEPVPHLTIGDGADRADLERAALAIRPELPLDTFLTEVQLICGDSTPGSWECLARFPLESG